MLCVTVPPSPQPFSMAAVYGDALAKLNRMDVLIVGMTGSGVETGKSVFHFLVVTMALTLSRAQPRIFCSRRRAA